jgi:hypothetical protein
MTKFKRPLTFPIAHGTHNNLPSHQHVNLASPKLATPIPLGATHNQTTSTNDKPPIPPCLMFSLIYNLPVLPQFKASIDPDLHHMSADPVLLVGFPSRFLAIHNIMHRSRHLAFRRGVQDDLSKTMSSRVLENGGSNVKLLHNVH